MDTEIDTIALYLNPQRQKPLYDYLLSLNPRLIIMNPGTENPKLAEIAKKQNISVIKDCVLMMLNSDRF